MLKEKLYYLICSILLVNHIHADIMNKNDVLKIDVQKFNEMPGFDNCPKYSIGSYNYNKCSFNFYCKGEECTSDTINGKEFQFSNNSTYIVETCNLNYDEDCTTEKCNSDSDCLSNKCIKNYCSLNKDLPVIQCIDIEIYDKKTSKFTTKMNCGKSEGDYCLSNDECATNYCFNDKCSYYGSPIKYKKLNNDTVIMKKEDVLKLDIEKYNNLKVKMECPDYSIGNVYFNECSIDFYCQDDECNSINENSHFVSFKNKNGKVEKFISEIVDESLLNQIDQSSDNDLYGDEHMIRTVKCTNNSDCLSNRCVNNICLFNPESTITECVDINTYKLSKLGYVAKVHCGKITNGKCTKDDECASNECKDGQCIRVRHNYYEMAGFGLGFVLFFSFPVIIVIIIAVCICCFCCLCKHKKAKAKRYVKTGEI